MRDMVIPKIREDVRLKDPPTPLLLLPPGEGFSGGDKAIAGLPAPMRPASFFHLLLEVAPSNTDSF
jgi:hypothetical protein